MPRLPVEGESVVGCEGAFLVIHPSISLRDNSIHILGEIERLLDNGGRMLVREAMILPHFLDKTCFTAACHPS